MRLFPSDRLRRAGFPDPCVGGGMAADVVPSGAEGRPQLLEHAQDVFRPVLGVLRVGENLEDGAAVSSGLSRLRA